MKDNGGPAFPFPTENASGFKGMSLRDWFAGMALQGFVTSAMHNQELNISSTLYARTAYALADAMLAERTK